MFFEKIEIGVPLSNSTEKRIFFLFTTCAGKVYDTMIGQIINFISKLLYAVAQIDIFSIHKDVFVKPSKGGNDVMTG